MKLNAEILKNLPADVRKTLKAKDLKVFTGMLLIQEKIADHFILVARSDARLREFKAEHGYCAGRPYCMTFVGTDAKHKSCKACRLAFIKAHEGHGKNIRSEYGHLQFAKKAAKAKKA